MTIELSFHPLTRNQWTDLEELFGRNGACAGCWCMYWKLRGKEYEDARHYETRQMHKAIVDSGTSTGLLAYSDGEVVGWVAVEPRSAYDRLAHSRIIKPVDDGEEVWSVTCFYVAKKFRRMGITVRLLNAAVEHVKQMGGKIVEGYPVETENDLSNQSMYRGAAAVFLQAGFKEVARHAPTRPIFRFDIQ